MKRVIFAAVSTITGLVMLLSFKTSGGATVAAPSTDVDNTPSSTTAPAAPSPTTGRTTTGSTSRGTSTTSAPSTTNGTTSGTTSGTATVTGAVAQTRYGPVQVQITVTNGTITAVKAVEYPTDRSRDRQISSYAIPQLDHEALAAKSAKIDMVSGATYTSMGYLTSLQSALDKAGLA
jgi:uncharacterized protein with FMN-binding domain